MHIANLMVLIAALLPYATVGAAKTMRGYDNAQPRHSLSTLDGWRARANWAHQNGFEAFPAFAAAVILAEISHADAHRVGQLAVAFIVLRLAYIAAYLTNAASIRSLIWGLGFGCTLWLFILSL